jgi:hypothetical protein
MTSNEAVLEACIRVEVFGTNLQFALHTVFKESNLCVLAVPLLGTEIRLA